MALHRIRNERHQLYFRTITCYKWLPLIVEANAYQSLYRWFECTTKIYMARKFGVQMPQRPLTSDVEGVEET
jgi:hypothetical protein